MAMQPIVIYGAGGFAREVLTLIEDINRERARWQFIGFLDDNAASVGRSMNGHPILGGLDWLDSANALPHVALGVGNPATKRKLACSLRGRVAGFPQLVHPNVVMSSRVDMGEGVIITAGNILTTETRLGDFSMLNLMCTVGHDSTIGEYATVSPGVNVSGNVHIGEGADIGTGVKIVQGVGIGEWTIVGAGAVVARDLPPNCTAVGVPAKPIKLREPGWHLE